MQRLLVSIGRRGGRVLQLLGTLMLEMPIKVAATLVTLLLLLLVMSSSTTSRRCLAGCVVNRIGGRAAASLVPTQRLQFPQMTAERSGGGGASSGSVGKRRRGGRGRVVPLA